MFSKDQRITKKDDFQKIYKQGFVYKFDNFKVFILKNNLEKSRACVTVSKKVSPMAVKRNKIKRKLRYALKPIIDNSPKKIDVLAVVNNVSILKIKTSQIKNALSIIKV